MQPPKKKKPAPQPKKKAFIPHGRRPKERTVMTDLEDQPVTQSQTPAAGPFAHTDPDAQAEVQKQLNLRIAHDTRVPYIPAKVPPGLSPNQAIALAQAGGIEYAVQTDKPEPPAEESEQQPQE